MSGLQDPATWRALNAVTVVLVRHGRTAANAEHRLIGRTDVPLDDVGVAQARRLADTLSASVDRVVCSPLLRAKQTAAFLGLPLSEDPSLVELHQGDLEGRLYADALEEYPAFFDAWAEDPSHARVPGGETLTEVTARTSAALARWVATCAPGEVLAVVAHQMVIAGFTCTIAGQPLTRWRQFTVRNASATVLWHGQQGWRAGVRDWCPGDDERAV